MVAGTKKDSLVLRSDIYFRCTNSGGFRGLGLKGLGFRAGTLSRENCQFIDLNSNPFKESHRS